jgi:hypothetical protein
VEEVEEDVVQWRRRPEVREVTMAAEEPRPVLCTLRIVQLRGAKGMGSASCSSGKVQKDDGK